MEDLDLVLIHQENQENNENERAEESTDERAGFSAASPGALMQVGASIPCPYGYGCYGSWFPFVKRRWLMPYPQGVVPYP